MVDITPSQRREAILKEINTKHQVLEESLLDSNTSSEELEELLKIFEDDLYYYELELKDTYDFELRKAFEDLNDNSINLKTVEDGYSVTAGNGVNFIKTEGKIFFTKDKSLNKDTIYQDLDKPGKEYSLAFNANKQVYEISELSVNNSWKEALEQ